MSQWDKMLQQKIWSHFFKCPGLNKIQFQMYDHYLKNETELHENVSTGTESFV